MVLLQATTRFPHRANEDGTFDSICRHCYATVASSSREAELALPEHTHICDPETLSRLRQRTYFFDMSSVGPDAQRASLSCVREF